MRADLDLLRLASSRLPIDFHAIEERHLGHAARALEDLGVDGIGRDGLTAAAITAGFIKPIDLSLDLRARAEITWTIYDRGRSV
jgi:hypothetical protein